MAKVTGTQDVPSELLDLYRNALGEQTPINGISRRYPFRVPTMQTEKGHPSVKQLAQRARFNTVRGNFETLSPGDRARWYAAMPEWGSVLWYYNYFMLSGLSGNADPEHGGAGLIKSINHYTFTLLSGWPANVNVVIDEIDAAKSVVFFYGAGYKSIGPEGEGAAISFPYLISLAAELAVVKAALYCDVNAGCSLTVIEYI